MIERWKREYVRKDCCKKNKNSDKKSGERIKNKRKEKR